MINPKVVRSFGAGKDKKSIPPSRDTFPVLVWRSDAFAENVAVIEVVVIYEEVAYPLSRCSKLSNNPANSSPITSANLSLSTMTLMYHDLLNHGRRCLGLPK